MASEPKRRLKSAQEGLEVRRVCEPAEAVADWVRARCGHKVGERIAYADDRRAASEPRSYAYGKIRR
jgi:hypothetical protein